MKKLLLITLLPFATLLFAKERATCNTVQLVSYVKNDDNLNLAYSQSYPADCKVMQIGNAITVRCGCFERVEEAAARLKELQLEYKNASLASTYRFRFGKQQERVSKKEKELRLMLQVFLYKGDLEDAYKIAQLGYRQHPNSYYWNEKMANISMWTNRSQRAMMHLRKMYEIRYDPALEEKLIAYAKAHFQYENIEPLALQKVKRDPSEENINFLIAIYKKMGFPEKAIAVLEQQYYKTHDPMLLSKALQLSLELGDMQLAHKYVTLIEPSTPYTKEEAALLAQYYYVKRDLQKAFDALLHVQDADILHNPKDPKELRYFELKSDIGWYLQKNRPAAKASLILINHHKARISDYERVTVVYQDINPDIAAKAAKEAYKKYKLSYMFFSYANSLLNKKRFTELAHLYNSVDETHSPLVDEAMYWVIKARLYNHQKAYTLEEEALQKALQRAPQNLEIQAALLWHFIEIQDTKNIYTILYKLEDAAHNTPSLYFTLASAYFSLHNIDRARFYLSKTALYSKEATKSLQYRLLEASILQNQNKTDRFKAKMREILQALKKEMQETPSLKKNPDFLSTYLHVAMYVLRAEKFEKKLRKARHILDKKTYDELNYSWAVHIGAYEKSHAILKKAAKKEPWMLFSDALIFHNYVMIENILAYKLRQIGHSDALSGALLDRQISLAQSQNFNGFDTNSHDLAAYIKQIELSKQRSDLLNIKLSRYHREPLLQYYTKLKNRSYIGGGWNILSDFEYYKNSTTDDKTLIYVPKSTYRASLGIHTKQSRLEAKMVAGYHHMMANYFSWKLEASYRLSNDFTLSAKLALSDEAQESTQLYLGGKKDLAQSALIYKLLNSTTITTTLRTEKFYSQDDVSLGKGEYFNANIAYQIRNGYPDMLISCFYDRGIYNETAGSRGVIDQLQNQNFQVLPNDFYNIGIGFSYGIANKNLYTRVWRPYFEFFPYYNSDLDDYTYGFNLGYGGKVFHQDHLRIGASYTDSVNGIGGKIFEIYLDYQFLYTLSKEL